MKKLIDLFFQLRDKQFENHFVQELVDAAGIAGVAAMANIPEVNSHQTFAVGVGVGGFDGQQAVAVGASARVNDNLTVKASVAANNEEVVWGAGAAIGW